MDVARNGGTMIDKEAIKARLEAATPGPTDVADLLNEVERLEGENNDLEDKLATSKRLRALANKQYADSFMGTEKLLREYEELKDELAKFKECSEMGECFVINDAHYYAVYHKEEE